MGHTRKEQVAAKSSRKKTTMSPIVIVNLFYS